MFRRSLFFATGVVICAVAVGAPCAAQETPTSAQEPPTVQSAPVRGLPVDNSKTYTYEFDDDILNAPGARDVPKMRVLPRASRQTLMRPRASFIVPLLRSIETNGDPYPPPIHVRVSSYYERR
jgi:hypothetical protein